MSVARASVAIVAALPREIAGVLRGAKPDPALKLRGIYLYRVDRAVIVAAGMGGARAALGVEAALQCGDVRMLVSAGLAGACMASICAGSVIGASTVVDVRTGERFETSDGEQQNVLATAPQIASAREKARLAAAYGAAMVDMEAATVARLAQAHGLGFRAIKAISDAHDFEMERLARFATPEGQFRTAAFAFDTALRPGQWRSAMTLGRNSGGALRALADRLLSIIDAA